MTDDILRNVGFEKGNDFVKHNSVLIIMLQKRCLMGVVD